MIAYFMSENYWEGPLSYEDAVATAVECGSINPETMTEEEKNMPYMVDVEFTVTPGAGAVECLVEFNNDGNFGEISPRVWIDNMLIDVEDAPEDGLISQHLVYKTLQQTTYTAQAMHANVNSYVYVTWTDAEGNWYETIETVLFNEVVFEGGSSAAPMNK